MKPSLLRASAAAILWLAGLGAASAMDGVVASIRPVASLVAGVMDGAGAPDLIVEAGASPHTYSLKPSGARALQKAKLIFWIGPDLEAFLDKPIDSLGEGATVVTLSKADGVELLPARRGGAFEKHQHDHAGEEHDAHEHAHEMETGEHEHEHDHEADAAEHADHHDDEGTDWHVWLDPMNAKAFVAAIAEALSKADPANAALYARNAAAVSARIDALAADVTADLAPVRGKPFIVFHDAYQYFEHRFGVAAAGSITVSPENIPGAARVQEIRSKIAESGAVCVFSEPQFEPRLVRVVTEGTNARTGVLDPLGSDIADGPDLYFSLIRDMAKALKSCLAEAS